MAVRFYLCDVIGDGTEFNPFRAVVFDLLTPNPQWKIHDCRVDEIQATGEMLAWADVTDAQHAVLTGDSRVRYAPFENDAGEPLTVNDPIGEINATKRNQIQSFFENRHIPMQGLSLTDEIYVLIRRYISRCRIRQYLHENDYTELLDATISDVPAAKRNAIKNRLEELGFDLSGITGGTTIREALVQLITQDNVAF